jgi:hypothetical protein
MFHKQSHDLFENNFPNMAGKTEENCENIKENQYPYEDWTGYIMTHHICSIYMFVCSFSLLLFDS